MVVPTIGTVMMFRLATSTPLRIASGTSRALPSPAPTRPLPSPTTISAEKENLRPPLTTLATRLRLTSRSVRSPPIRSPRSFIWGGRTAMLPLYLELEAGFSGGLRERLHPAVIEVPAAIEHHAANAGLACLAGYRLADLGRGGEVVFGQLQIRGRRRRQRPAAGVVDELNIGMGQAPEDRQSRPLRGSRQLHPDSPVASLSRPLTVDWCYHSWSSAAVLRQSRDIGDFVDHLALPALPALRRIRSPRYMTPFPL